MNRKEAEELLTNGPASVPEWNARVLSGEVIPDLSRLSLPLPILPGIDLHGCNLSYCYIDAGVLTAANLRDAVLTGATILQTTLSDANLRGAKVDGGAHLDEINLDYADLRKADFTRTRAWNPIFSGADFSDAILDGVELRSCIFYHANLSRCSFVDANLSTDDSAPYSNLFGAILVDTDFTRADLTQVMFGGTTIACDLSCALHLETVKHYGPSSLFLSESLLKLPNEFLRGCGFDAGSLSRLSTSRGTPNCFISYSAKDKCFVERLTEDLRRSDFSCWNYADSARLPGRLWSRIDEGIRKCDVFILIASASSLDSLPVTRELERALEREHCLAREKEPTDILVPIALDNSVFEWNHHLAADVRNRVVVDMSEWNDPRVYDTKLQQLIRGLREAYGHRFHG